MMYEGFAKVYDALMADVDYREWAGYYMCLAQRHGVPVRRAADCACGTGSLTLALAAQGVQMTGLDLSMDMLREAGVKARGQGLMLPFVRQDMRVLRLHRQMDALFCACDGVNYLMRPADVQAFFAAAYASLRPGGGLYFDVSTEYKLAHTLGNRCLAEDGEEIAYLWQNHYDEASRTIQMDMTFFVREADGRYARFGETHFQRAHTAQELLTWLQAAGFEQVALYGDKTFTRPAPDEARIHIAAIKPPQEEMINR